MEFYLLILDWTFPLTILSKVLRYYSLCSFSVHCRFDEFHQHELKDYRVTFIILYLTILSITLNAVANSFSG